MYSKRKEFAPYYLYCKCIHAKFPIKHIKTLKTQLIQTNQAIHFVP